MMGYCFINEEKLTSKKNTKHAKALGARQD